MNAYSYEHMCFVLISYGPNIGAFFYFFEKDIFST